MNRQQHWEKVWSRDNPREVGWYQEAPTVSLGLVEATEIGLDARILDVGGGASTLVDGLLDRGFINIEVLDLTDSAFDHSRSRLGARSERVKWTTKDVTTFRAAQPIDLWHDRAVLHFLTKKRDRELYIQSLTESIAPSGHAIIATFALDGPKKCSGLEVVRYGSREIMTLLGGDFQLLEIVRETHLTPGKTKQRFTYFRFQRDSWNPRKTYSGKPEGHTAVLKRDRGQERMMLPEKQDNGFGDFYKSARYNKILDQKTTLLIHLATAMSTACYPWMKSYLGVARKKGTTDEEIGAVQSIVMAVEAGRIRAQFREVRDR